MPTSPDPGTPPALDVADVSKRYGRRWALARLSFTLKAGSSLLLTGHNGSGKTTLLRLVATAITPTAGKLRVFGLDCVTERDAIRRRVALLSHASYLYEELTAEQNLVVMARLLGIDRARETVAALLERVGLSGRTEPVRHFSAGMRKRLAIGRLLLKAPDMALLDEPFGELDPRGITQMEGIIRDLASSGTTIVLATHLIEQGRLLCRERMHLAEGRATE